MTNPRDNEGVMLQRFLDRLEGGFGSVQEGLSDVRLEIRTLEGKVDTLTKRTDELKALEKRVDGLEARLNQALWLVRGGWAVVAVVATVAATILGFLR